MFYNYVKLADGTQIAYSDLLEDNTVEVAVERPVDWGFDSGRCLLPAYTWSHIEGFTDEDIAALTEFIRNNAPLILRLSREASKSYA